MTHGLANTRSQILIYSALLVPVSIAPAILGLTGWIYGGTAVTLGAIFMTLAYRVRRSTAELATEMMAERKLFKFSLYFLACLFGALVADRLILS